MTTATHSRTVQLIRSSGDAICLKIITPPRRRAGGLEHLRRQQPVTEGPRPSTTSGDGRGTDGVVQRTVNNTAYNVLPSQTVARQPLPDHHHHQQQQQQQQQQPRLPTARSMPDLSAAADNPEDHAHRHRNDNPTGHVPTSSDVDYRERVLYELTNQLRPSAAVVLQPPSAAPRAVNDDRPATRSADESTTAGRRQKRPAPPPRGMSLSSRPHASTPAVSLPTVASPTGSEFKELLAVSAHAAAAAASTAAADYERRSFAGSSSTSRSVISGEHLVLPSQLKKQQRSPTDVDASRQDGADDNESSRQPSTSHDGVKLNNGHIVSASGTFVEHRSPVPKRPAPPPPSSSKLTTALPATRSGEEVNFLVMAEKARRQYILSRLARDAFAATDKPSARPASDRRTTTRATGGQQAAVNGSTTTDGANRYTANGENSDHSFDDLRVPTSSAHVDVEVLSDAGRTVQRTADNSSLSAESSGTSPSGPLPPVVPPRRPPRNSRQHVELGSNEIQHVERRLTSNVEENGGTSMQVTADELSAGDKQAVSSAAWNTTRDTAQQHDCDAHGRRSHAKLIRGKNVLIRRSGASRLLADDTLASISNNKHSSTNGHRPREDTGKIQQLASTCDVDDVLPPPPDFAD